MDNKKQELQEIAEQLMQSENLAASVEILRQFAVSKILSEVQIGRAFLYYWKHKRYVDDMVNLTQNQFEPSQMEDKNDPMLWKAEYWKWFLANCR